MIRGAKPPLSVIKQITGNPSRRELNHHPPEPKGEVRKPVFLTGDASILWDKYAPDLEAHGILTSWDVEIFGTWCVLMADYQKEPERYTTQKLTEMRKIAELFGMTGPASRERIKVNGREDHQEKAERYFA